MPAARKEAIHCDSAPAAIGPYSQAVKSGNLVFLSGQIPLDPATMKLVSGGIVAQTRQVLANLSAVIQASGGKLDQLVKLTLYLTDLGDFPVVNDIMSELLKQPYPARVTVQVSALPKGASIEIEGILAL